MNENGTQSSALQPPEGSPPAAPAGRSPLTRLLSHFRRRPPSPPAKAADDPGLTRARAALEEARLEMPGLLSDPPPSPADLGHDLTPAAAQAVESPRRSDDLGRLGFVEDLLGRLEEERRQLGSEVAALRLIVEELREALLRLDEPSRPTEPAPLRLQTFGSDLPAVGSTEPAAASLPPDERHLLPAGSVGIEVHLLSVQHAEMLADIQLALANLPELDGVRIAGFAEQEATLRCYLRRPQTETSLLEALQRALPTAKPLAGPATGRLLLRMRPV